MMLRQPADGWVVGQPGHDIGRNHVSWEARLVEHGGPRPMQGGLERGTGRTAGEKGLWMRGSYPREGEGGVGGKAA